MASHGILEATDTHVIGKLVKLNYALTKLSVSEVRTKSSLIIHSFFSMSRQKKSINFFASYCKAVAQFDSIGSSEEADLASPINT